MLQGLIHDVTGTVYSPTFTKRHDRQYCYYISRSFAENKDHPDGIMARLPAHEIEAVVEKAARGEIRRLCGDTAERNVEYILEHQNEIPGHDLVRACVDRVTIGPDQITIRIKPGGFGRLAEKSLKVKVKEASEIFEVNVPFTTGKTRRGAIVIEPESKGDISSGKLKKLIQGIIWRDEHFNGVTLRDIAKSENCSEGFVGQCIFCTLELTPANFPAC